MYYRNLVLATILDPRYKLAFFDEDQVIEYRRWLESEALKMNDVSGTVEVINGQRESLTCIESVLEGFLEVAKIILRVYNLPF